MIFREAVRPKVLRPNGKKSKKKNMKWAPGVD